MTSKLSTVSRRNVLKAAGAIAGAAAVAGGASTLLGGGAAQQGAPAVITNTQAGRKFRAFVKFSKDAPSVIQLTARALTARQILVRTEAAQTCYTSVREVLLPSASAPRQPSIVGHGGVGIVEAVGPQAITCRVGDRVVVNFHAACGRCFSCLWMRSDQCVNRGEVTAIPICDMPDGTPISFSNGTGMTELMIVHEEHATPVFTSVTSPELAMLPCVGGAGLGMATSQNAPVKMASDVVIFGAGPVGLSALQGARIKGASRLIMVEPIRYRRDLAMKLGATDVLDPNQFKREPKSREGGFGRDDYRWNDGLVDRIREMVKEPHDRPFAGAGKRGPDHVMEAVGGDQMPPKEVAGPDPTGIAPLQQTWELCSKIGTAISCTVGQPPDAMVQIPGSQFGDSSKNWTNSTGGGTNDRRDTPRYVRLMETGQLNMKALVTKTYPLNQTKEAYQVCADRTSLATVVTPNT